MTTRRLPAGQRNYDWSDWAGKEHLLGWCLFTDHDTCPKVSALGTTCTCNCHGKPKPKRKRKASKGEQQ